VVYWLSLIRDVKIFGLSHFLVDAETKIKSFDPTSEEKTFERGEA
jgi:hypothetical protein